MFRSRTAALVAAITLLTAVSLNASGAFSPAAALPATGITPASPFTLADLIDRAQPPAALAVIPTCDIQRGTLRSRAPSGSGPYFVSPVSPAPCNALQPAPTWSPAIRAVELLNASAASPIDMPLPAATTRNWGIRVPRDEKVLAAATQAFDQMLAEFAQNGVSLWARADKWTDAARTAPRARFAQYRLDDGTDIMMVLQADEREMMFLLSRVRSKKR